MYMFENQITLESRPLLEKYLKSFEYKSSGLSFTSLYMWRNINLFSWQVIGDYLCISGLSHLETEKEEYFFFPPLTGNGIYETTELKKTILEAKRIFEKKGQPFSIRLLPYHMIPIIEEAFPGEFQFIEDRPNYDYIYLTQDLINLTGRKYNKKRNHLNYFHEHYQYEYVPLPSAMAEEAMVFIQEFNERKKLPEHEMKLLKMEEIAMEDAFHNIERVGYRSGALLIDGKIQALSIGGDLWHDTIVVHVEKANAEYRGAYQAINNEFCKHEALHVKFINREEDMDIQGLREAKLSYRPIELLKLYIGVFKNK